MHLCALCVTSLHLTVTLMCPDAVYLRVEVMVSVTVAVAVIVTVALKAMAKATVEAAISPAPMLQKTPPIMVRVWVRLRLGLDASEDIAGGKLVVLGTSQDDRATRIGNMLYDPLWGVKGEARAVAVSVVSLMDGLQMQVRWGSRAPVLLANR